MAIKSQTIETKLTAARTRLILDKPFLGALVLRLPMLAAKPDWCPTTATDARAFFYNPEYIAALSMEETQFMLAHEALHCALSHFARRQHRIQHRWDLACDYAINPLLIEDGLKPPPNAPIMPGYKGMTAEEIYPMIDANDKTETLDVHAYDGDNQRESSQSSPRENDLVQSRRPEQQAQQKQGAGAEKATPESDAQPGGHEAPPPLQPDEQEILYIQWQQRLAGAAQQAMQAGKLGGDMARLIDHLLQPQLPWRMLLARYMTAAARDDYSYMRPARREGDHILPSLRSQQLDVVIALDTSGSIKDAELAEFITDVNILKGQIRARLTLLPCDTQLAEGAPWYFEPWEELTPPESIKGGGGTSFLPVFAWVERQGLSPDLLLYFTDAEGEFPVQEPPYPTIWLVKGRATVPWGQRIQLN